MRLLNICECGDSLDSGERCQKCGKLGKPQKIRTMNKACYPGRKKKRYAS